MNPLLHLRDLLLPVDERGRRSPSLVVILGLGILSAALLFVMNLAYGELNQDEGWYLYAARLVSQGELPYRDFAFTQGPVFPLVYSLFDGWIRVTGLLGGRLVTALFSALALAAAMVLAARSAPSGRGRIAAGAVFLLVAGNVWHGYYATMVKTYGLASFFTLFSLLALLPVYRSRGRYAFGAWASLGLSAVLLSLAVGTRLTTGILAPAVVLALFLFRDRAPRGAFLVFGAVFAAGFAAVYGPFLLKYGEAARFWLLGFHSARVSENGLVYKLAFVSQNAQVYLAASAVAVLSLLWRWMKGPEVERPETPGARSRLALEGTLWLGTAAITFAHVATPFPHAEYQTLAYPLFAAAVAATSCRLLDAALRRDFVARWFLGGIFLLTAATAWGSPLNSAWFLSERHLIWWPARTESPIVQLRRVAKEVRDLAVTTPGAKPILFTPDVYLAVEANLPVVRGLEMGPFSYFPELSAAEARKRHVHNRETLVTALHDEDAAVFAGSGYAFSIASPQIKPVPAGERELLWKEAEAAYLLDRRSEHFGQANTTLVYGSKRRAAAPVPQE